MATIVKRGKAFRVQVRRTGYPTKSKTFPTQREAKAWARQYEAELDKTSPRRARKADGRRVKDALNLYARERCGFALQFDGEDDRPHSLSPRDALDRFEKVGDNKIPNAAQARTWRALVGFMQFWFERVGEIELVKLERLDIREAIDSLGDLKPKTLDDYHRVLHAALAFAVEHEWIRANPAAFKKKGGYIERDRVLTLEEEASLIEALADNPRLRLITRIGLATGLRLGNILALEWHRIDPKTGETFVPETKNGEAITTRISGEALRELKAWAKVRQIGSDWVFPAARGFNHMAWPRSEWLDALKAAGIPNKGDTGADKHRDPAAYWGLRFHDLRHTLATRLADAGASQAELMTVLGHKSPQMTARYVKRDSIARIDNAFARLGVS